MSLPRLRWFFIPARRMFSSTGIARVDSFSRGPAPPQLPKTEQDIYEKLQRSSRGAFSTPEPSIPSEREPSSQELQSRRAYSEIDLSSQTESQAVSTKEGSSTGSSPRVKATGEGDELHPDVRRGAQPEFEGERNPKTGEVGGPKNEPLRWGGKADWSYNGRVTDF